MKRSVICAVLSFLPVLAVVGQIPAEEVVIGESSTYLRRAARNLSLRNGHS